MFWCRLWCCCFCQHFIQQWSLDAERASCYIHVQLILFESRCPDLKLHTMTCFHTRERRHIRSHLFSQLHKRIFNAILINRMEILDPELSSTTSSILLFAFSSSSSSPLDGRHVIHHRSALLSPQLSLMACGGRCLTVMLQGEKKGSITYCSYWERGGRGGGEGTESEQNRRGGEGDGEEKRGRKTTLLTGRWKLTGRYRRNK